MWHSPHELHSGGVQRAGHYGERGLDRYDEGDITDPSESTGSRGIAIDLISFWAIQRGIIRETASLLK